LYLDRWHRISEFMNKDTDAKSAKVIPLRQKAEEGEDAFVRRWGARVADHGYTKVPHMFFALQAELGLTCQQAMVLLHLMDHWWHTSSGLPWPSKKTLATRLNGMTERNVQRILTELENESLIERQARYYESGGQKSNAYDLTGLITRLKKLEPKFREAREAKKARRARAEAPARKRRAGTPPVAK
jgi:predicted transcriptional regulator